MPDRIRAIGKAIGLDLKEGISNEEAGITVADSIRRLIKEIGIPSLKDLNIQESGLNIIADLTPGDVCAIFIPKKTTSEDVLRLLQKEYAL